MEFINACAGVSVYVYVYAYIYVRVHIHIHIHARSYLKSIALYSIRILFTSKPIHELRLNQTVANTVIALTIRVI